MKTCGNSSSSRATTIFKLFELLCEILSRSKNDLVIKMILVKIEVIKIKMFTIKIMFKIKIIYANLIKIVLQDKSKQARFRKFHGKSFILAKYYTPNPKLSEGKWTEWGDPLFVFEGFLHTWLSEILVEEPRSNHLDL